MGVLHMTGRSLYPGRALDDGEQGGQWRAREAAGVHELCSSGASMAESSKFEFRSQPISLQRLHAPTHAPTHPRTHSPTQERGRALKCFRNSLNGSGQ